MAVSVPKSGHLTALNGMPGSRGARRPRRREDVLGVLRREPERGGRARRRLARRGRHCPCAESEVLDVVEEQLRHGRVEPRLFGTLAVPFQAGRTQARKTRVARSEARPWHPPFAGCVAQLRPGVRYLLGPGGTDRRTRPAARAGDHAARRRRASGRRSCVLADATEQQLLAEIAGGRLRPSSRDRRTGLPARPRQPADLGPRRSANSIRRAAHRRRPRAEADRARRAATARRHRRPRGRRGLAGFARITTGVSSTSIYRDAPESTARTEHTGVTCARRRIRLQPHP